MFQKPQPSQLRGEGSFTHALDNNSFLRGVSITVIWLHGHSFQCSSGCSRPWGPLGSRKPNFRDFHCLEVIVSITTFQERKLRPREIEQQSQSQSSLGQGLNLGLPTLVQALSDLRGPWSSLMGNHSSLGIMEPSLTAPGLHMEALQCPLDRITPSKMGTLLTDGGRQNWCHMSEGHLGSKYHLKHPCTP